MTEKDAKDWVKFYFGTFAIERLTHFANLLASEMAHQNLIARSTADQFWTRHVVDSAQLIQIAGGERSIWIDVGTGAGFPGLVVGLLWRGPVTLIEPRRLRAHFLERCIRDLALTNVYVCQSRSENVRIPVRADVISARAVGTLEHLLSITAHLASRQTRFVLPKGMRAETEIAAARAKWHGRFHVEQSLVDRESGIIVAEGVSRR